MKLNAAVQPPVTHEGGRAKNITPLQALERSVMSCMLWEDEFYEDEQTIAQRIGDLVKQCDPLNVLTLAMRARSDGNLRHVPLLMAREMARHNTHKRWVASLLLNIIQRPDELAEFLAIYWKDGKKPLSAQVKKGLALAFDKFSEYQFAKYDRDGAIKLRDVMFLVHPKPTKDKEELYKKIASRTLDTPDTWETALSAGADKKETFTRLMAEKKLGALAFLRNLRNMVQAGIDEPIIHEYAKGLNIDRVLPYRFLAAEKYAPSLSDVLEELFFKSIDRNKKLDGTTVILVDVSGSMDAVLSNKSEMTRLDAACAIAMIVREMCDYGYVMTFSNGISQVPYSHGFGLAHSIVFSQPHQGTNLFQAVQVVKQQVKHDRLIVITDEQAHPGQIDLLGTGQNNYMINIASAKNGVGYGKAWTHIDGFSGAVADWLYEYETERNEV